MALSIMTWEVTRSDYPDLQPTLAAEKQVERHGICISSEMLAAMPSFHLLGRGRIRAMRAAVSFLHCSTFYGSGSVHLENL